MRGGCTSHEIKQGSGFGCHSPWHSTSLHCPVTARSIANISHPLLSVCLTFTYLFFFFFCPFSADTYRFQNVLFSFLSESMILFLSLLYFCYQVQTGSTGLYSNWFPPYQNITNFQSNLTRQYEPDFAENDSLLNLQKSHYQNYSKFNLLSV